MTEKNEKEILNITKGVGKNEIYLPASLVERFDSSLKYDVEQRFFIGSTKDGKRFWTMFKYFLGDGGFVEVKKQELKKLLLDIKNAVDEKINTIEEKVNEDEANGYIAYYSQILQDVAHPDL